MQGEIPVEIAQLKELGELILSNNEFTGNLPVEVMSLAKLSTMMVSDNRLNQEYVSFSRKNPVSLKSMQGETATATMDVEKE